MSVTPASTETQTVPRPRETSEAETRHAARHTTREYWDVDRCRWMPCPTRSEG